MASTTRQREDPRIPAWPSLLPAVLRQAGAILHPRLTVLHVFARIAGVPYVV